MKAHRSHKLDTGAKHRKRHPIQPPDLLTRTVRTLVGALIGILLISLISLVIFAFVIKAFTMGDEMSFQLLNSAINLLSTALGATLGYFLGRKPHA